jgi:ABC-type cobalamin transport system permease subunit
MSDDVVHQVRRGLRHAPRAARGAKAAALAAEREQLVVAALAAAQPQEAMRQDAALQEGFELVLDEPGQLGASAGLGVGDEAGRVLLYQAVQRSLFRTVAFVVDRGAIGSPLGLLRRGSHDGLPVG